MSIVNKKKISLEENVKAGSKNARFHLGACCGNEYLTQREFDVLKYIMLGYTAKKIALCLGVSYRTVETYVELLKLKLRCNRKSEIIERALALGIAQVVFSSLDSVE